MPTQQNSGRKPRSPATAVVVKKAVKGKTAPSPATGTPAKPVLSREVRASAGVSIRLLARLTGFSERAIAGWESGAPLSEPARRRLLEFERFRQRLAEVVQPESIPEWLDTPNDAFEGLKPVEVIERGEIDRLWNMIFYLESGVAT